MKLVQANWILQLKVQYMCKQSNWARDLELQKNAKQQMLCIPVESQIHT